MLKLTMKTCPFCWENIQDTAKKCRYCWEWLEEKHIKNKANNQGKVSKVKIRENTKNKVEKDEKYIQKKADQFEFWYTIWTLKRTFNVFVVCLIIIWLICTWCKKRIPWYLIFLISAIISALTCYQDYLPKTRKKAIEEHIEKVKHPVEEKELNFPFAKIVLLIILWFFWLLALALFIWFLTN